MSGSVPPVSTPWVPVNGDGPARNVARDLIGVATGFVERHRSRRALQEDGRETI